MKKELLEKLISDAVDRNGELTSRLDKGTLEKFKKYLFNRVDALFKCDHNPEEVANNLAAILQTIQSAVPTKVVDVSINRRIHNILREQIIDKALEPALYDIVKKQEAKRAHLNQLHYLLFDLRGKNYFTFLKNLQTLLQSIRQSIVDPEKQAGYLVELLQNISFDIEDILQIKQLSNALKLTDFLEGAALKSFEKDLKALEQALTHVCPLPAGSIQFDDKAISKIVKTLETQQLENSPYNLLVADVMGFFEKYNISKILRTKKLQAAIDEYCKEQTFAYLTRENVAAFEGKLESMVPPSKIENLSEEASQFLYRKICKQILKHKQTQWGEPGSYSLDVQAVIANGGNNTAMLARVKNRYSQKHSQSFIFRQSTNDANQVAPEMESEAVQKINQIDHPAIIKTYHNTVAENNGNQKFEVQYVEYGSRGSLFTAPLDLNQRAPIFRVLVDLISTFHENNVAHLDFRWANLVQDSTGLVKAIDFGEAAFEDEKKRLIGLPKPSLPPEAYTAATHENINYRAVDIWSLGILLHQLYTGRDPLLNSEDHVFLGITISQENNYFERDAEGNYINQDAGEVAGLICKLLETDVKKRIENFEGLIAQDKILNLSLKEAYSKFNSKDKAVQFQEEITKSNLTLDAKIARYQQEIIEYKDQTVVLTAEDKAWSAQHVDFYIEVINSRDDISEAEKKRPEYRKFEQRLLRAKAVEHQQQLEKLETTLQTLIAERNKLKREVMLKKIFSNHEKCITLVEERGALLDIANASVDDQFADETRKQLYAEFSQAYQELKESKITKQGFLDLIKAKISNLKTQIIKKQPCAALIEASELANVILSYPKYQPNTELGELYKEITKFMTDLKQKNPLTTVNNPQAKLNVMSSQEPGEIKINNAGASDNKKAKKPPYKKWKKLIKQYNFIEKIQYRSLINTLKQLRKLRKKFDKSISIDDQIKLAAEIIEKCQAWLDQNKDNYARRLDILALLNSTIVDLNKLIDKKPLEINENAGQQATNISTNKQSVTTKSALKAQPSPTSKFLLKAKAAGFAVKSKFFGRPDSKAMVDTGEAVYAWRARKEMR